MLELEDESTYNIKVSLLRTGIFDTFGDDMSAKLPRDYVTKNTVSQVEALNGSHSLVGAHVCKTIELHSGQWPPCMILSVGLSFWRTIQRCMDLAGRIGHTQEVATVIAGADAR